MKYNYSWWVTVRTRCTYVYRHIFLCTPVYRHSLLYVRMCIGVPFFLVGFSIHDFTLSGFPGTFFPFRVFQTQFYIKWHFVATNICYFCYKCQVFRGFLKQNLFVWFFRHIYNKNSFKMVLRLIPNKNVKTVCGQVLWSSPNLDQMFLISL